jgi:predicted RNase H-like HicB family nuclease
MKFRVLLQQDEEGNFVAECPTLPGCISQGKSRTEAVRNIKDAVRGYIFSLKKHDEPVPPSIDETMVEINA